MLFRSHVSRNESRQIQIRADFFNAFNHANLGAPNGYLDAGNSTTFGQALYGASPQSSGFPLVVPLSAQERHIQLQLKFRF